MLRFRILVSVVPLAMGAIMAPRRIPRPRPCIAIGNQTVPIASMSWHADVHVSFIDDPAAATIRVGIADSADDNACAVNTATQFLAVSATPLAMAPVIYLTRESPAVTGFPPR